ncbi:MAG: 50S ribosomal protein L32 [Candidatus Omnitrophica bacterium]|nr:50S ribosomal protein L32 [Candidatus Omnitrophota bacterium]
MALPKRKHCQARRDKRRSQWKITITGLTRCPQCANTIRSHRVCPSCGYYRGRQVVEHHPLPPCVSILRILSRTPGCCRGQATRRVFLIVFIG